MSLFLFQGSIMPVTSRPGSRKDSSRSRPGSRPLSRQGSALSTTSTITSGRLPRSGSGAEGSRVTLLASDDAGVDEVDLREELTSQLGVELAGCSRQRLRAMKMSFRRAANAELRITTKDLFSLLQVPTARNTEYLFFICTYMYV